MNDLKRLVDRLEELADPPGGRAAEDILNAAAGGSATATEGGPNRRRSSALLVTAAIVLVAGFVSLHVWDGDDTRLVTTPAGPTEASPSSASADEGSTASSAASTLRDGWRSSSLISRPGRSRWLSHLRMTSPACPTTNRQHEVADLHDVARERRTRARGTHGIRECEPGGPGRVAAQDRSSDR